MITNVKLFKNAVDVKQITSGAVLTVQLASGETFQVKDDGKFPLLQVDNDTKEVRIRGNIKRPRPIST